MNLHVGTSGWHYPAGRGTWNGVFYPPRRGRGFDELSYYAEHFDTVEVNASFYRPIDAPMAESWLRRTPADFVFSVKLFLKFTHPDMYLKRFDVKDWDVTRGDVDQFRAGVAPIADAGRLGAILAQFPSSFHAEPDTRAYVEWLLDALAGLPVAIELRHRSWDEDDRTASLLRAHGASRVAADSPVSPLGPIDDAAVTSAPVYLRFHGRNAERWWQHEEAEDRYDYLYSGQELTPVADAVRPMTTSTRRVLVYFNNHFSAKAVANAAILKRQLGDLVPGDYPVEMVRRYPELEGVVGTVGLF